MQEIKLNETPVRTARNFNINNIEIDDIQEIQGIKEFKNISINKVDENISGSENCSNLELTYGLSNFLTEQVQKDSNKKLHIEINGSNDKQLEIVFNMDKNNNYLVDDLEFVVNENAKATIVIKYESIGNLEFYHNGIIRINAKRNSNINVILVNLMNTNSQNFISIENTLEENAKLNYTVIDFGGKNSITNYYSNLIGDNSYNRINTIYIGKENQLFDLNYIGELRGKKSNIDIEVQGALKDNARKHFKGTIDFKKGCKKAVGNENEACMLLSDTAKSIALPMLLCSEEEVEGNHSSSAGKIDEKELFYIMSRGFTLKEAQKLIVRARFNKILENIKDEKLKEQVLSEIDERLE